MTYCTKCGTEVPEEAQFCPTCGTPVKIETAPTPRVATQPTTVPSSLFDRMVRAARLDVSLYEEVEADETATMQALIVVALSSICSGIGAGITEALAGHGLVEVSAGLLGGVLAALVSWFVWSMITYYIGTNVFGGTASFGELLRTIGFSNAPGVLAILVFIPFLGDFLYSIVSIWGLVAMVIAVRQSLDFSTGKAILTCIVGWIASILLVVIFGLLFAIPFILFTS